MTQLTRVYVDMVGDLFHCGHVELLRAARDLGDHPVVGVLSDEAAAAYKRRPVMTLSERVAVIEACRHVDEVIPDSPLRLTHASSTSTTLPWSCTATTLMRTAPKRCTALRWRPDAFVSYPAREASRRPS